MTPLASWAAILGGAVLLLLVYKSLDGWLGRKIEKAMLRNASPWRWGGEPGTRPPKGHKGCRDCGYFYPVDGLDKNGVCDDCRGHDDDLQAALDHAYEHDGIFVFAPCVHSTVEWIAHGGGSNTASLVCSDCRVALVTETFEQREWLAPEIEAEDHR